MACEFTSNMALLLTLRISHYSHCTAKGILRMTSSNPKGHASNSFELWIFKALLPCGNAVESSCSFARRPLGTKGNSMSILPTAGRSSIFQQFERHLVSPVKQWEAMGRNRKEWEGMGRFVSAGLYGGASMSGSMRQTSHHGPGPKLRYPCLRSKNPSVL